MIICLLQNISACIWVCRYVCVGMSLPVYVCMVHNHHRVFVPVPFPCSCRREGQYLAAWCLVSRALGLRAGLEWPGLGQAFPASDEAEQKQKLKSTPSGGPAQNRFNLKQPGAALGVGWLPPQGKGRPGLRGGAGPACHPVSRPAACCLSSLYSALLTHLP